jgi:hypothetical protein
MTLARVWPLLALFCLAAAGLALPPAHGGLAKEHGRMVVRAAGDQGILADGRAAQRLLEQRRLGPPTGLGSAAAAPAALATADDSRVVAPVARGSIVPAAERGTADSAARAHPQRGPPA